MYKCLTKHILQYDLNENVTPSMLCFHELIVTFLQILLGATKFNTLAFCDRLCDGTY